MSSSTTPSKPPLVSAVFDWARLPVIPTPAGERRDFFDATTRTLRNLECHATTLNPGETPHPPHRHPDEELIIVKEGTVEVLINDRVQRAGAGSIFFFGSNDLHGLRNVGTDRATYHVIRILTSDTPAA
jgi:mannose-6-phosphate isomerase-like protein (cupin superfamily)